ncbi:hypothetical protein JYU34_019446 [Plutella xylostella]|uniref:Uncharacterized protein n=1 Tax=Plutella xylostella TaxID=51655 RepID=A0ABQ7PWU9_PLUXY|nr:hypothetical protein JYU34_019446 [Plutella xylostella]
MREKERCTPGDGFRVGGACGGAAPDPHEGSARAAVASPHPTAPACVHEPTRDTTSSVNRDPLKC